MTIRAMAPPIMSAILARREFPGARLQRIGRRGLSTACIEGVLASASPYVAVMDARSPARRAASTAHAGRAKA